MKQIVINVSDGVKEIEISSRKCDNMGLAIVGLDAIAGDTVTIDVDCSGKMELRKITPVEFLNEMNKIARESGFDEEVAHSRMGALMCRVLAEQGFGEGVSVFDQQSKHYA
jgi:predicted RNase H-like nuclease (RuvC/YqgF family)